MWSCFNIYVQKQSQFKYVDIEQRAILLLVKRTQNSYLVMEYGALRLS
jgi:hypothetical protein